MQRLTPKLKFILACLFIYEAMALSDMFLNQPTNLFTALGVPVTIQISQLRRRLQEVSDVPELPIHLQKLLNKLASADFRGYYIRFGHEVVASCSFCHDFLDFFTFYAVKITLDYICTAAMVIVMTIQGSGKRKWRKWSLALIIGCWLADLFVAGLHDMPIPSNGRNCVMWHDRVWWLRHALMFVLPIILHALPYSYLPPSPLRSLIPALLSTERLVQRLDVFSMLQASAQRNPAIRENVAEYWANQELDANYGRNDPTVRAEAARLGLAYTKEQVDSIKDTQESKESTANLLGEAGTITSAMFEFLQGFRPSMTQPPPSEPAAT
ncbi:hypothetical protein FRB99_008357 [Tulasnella sp. 403]|nr:hypothetical protein FRB99_008357 [Tulasnella sp. 403]